LVCDRSCVLGTFLPWVLRGCGYWWLLFLPFPDPFPSPRISQIAFRMLYYVWVGLMFAVMLSAPCFSLGPIWFLDLNPCLANLQFCPRGASSLPRLVFFPFSRLAPSCSRDVLSFAIIVSLNMFTHLSFRFPSKLYPRAPRMSQTPRCSLLA